MNLLACAFPLAGGGMSAEEIRAAMRAAEDEGDAAAAAAVEKEAAAELDEFTKVGWGCGEPETLCHLLWPARPALRLPCPTQCQLPK